VAEVNWTTQSIEDINSIAEFISKDSRKYADALVDSFFSSALILESYPFSGRIVPELNDKAIRELIIGS
jgi:toxin ParE1/3/4